MNKKLIFGSVIVVAILTGVSLTSVVGYQSVKSDMKASPLFNIRTSRAIDEESKDFTSNYIGKEKQINIPIPKFDNRIKMLGRVIKEIKKLDNNQQKQLLNLVKKYKDVNTLKNLENLDETDAFNQLRNNPMIKKYSNETNFNIIHGDTMHTDEGCGNSYIIIGDYCLGGIILMILLAITSPIWFPLVLIIMIVGLALLYTFGLILCFFSRTASPW